MILRRWARRLALFAVVLALVVAIIAIALLSRARLELSASGVHTRLLLPVWGERSIALPVYSGSGDAVRMRGHLDGPIVRVGADGWSATWFCEDRAVSARGVGRVLRLQCVGRTYEFALADAPVPPAIGPMPERLVVISDLEGNDRFLRAALARVGVLDATGRWAFSNGHLVVLGDSVDRGRDVFAVLWRLHALAQQAHAAGGAVHLVLGNHEQYMLRGNVSRANPEHLHALREMGGHVAAFAADTVLGEWLRRQPVVLKLGPVLFAHGGISPAVSGLGVQDLNQAMSKYWRSGAARLPSKELEAVLGQNGVTQYRGYLMATADFYGLATTQEVSAVLEAYGANRIVVAHTPVAKVETVHGGRVIAVDVNDDGARPEVLLFENGVPRAIDIGVPRRVATASGRRTREISLFVPADRQTLIAMMRAMRELSDLPHPY